VFSLLIDSHAQIDSERYANDRAAMLGRAWEAGVGAVLAIGVGEDASGMRGALDHCRPPHLWCSSIARG
jgi:TatD DNase family protein